MGVQEMFSALGAGAALLSASGHSHCFPRGTENPQLGQLRAEGEFSRGIKQAMVCKQQKAIGRGHEISPLWWTPLGDLPLSSL